MFRCTYYTQQKATAIISMHCKNVLNETLFYFQRADSIGTKPGAGVCAEAASVPYHTCHS